MLTVVAESVRPASAQTPNDPLYSQQSRSETNQLTYPILKAQWLQHPDVEHISASSGVPGRSGIHNFQVTLPTQDSPYLPVLAVDPDFTETFGITLVAGRDFSPEFGTDTTEAFVLNQAAVDRLGWSSAVDRRLSLTYKGPSGAFTTKTGRVVGVVENFHYHSLHHRVEPLLLHVVPPSFYTDYVSVRIAPDQTADVLDALAAQWQAFSPGRPFEYYFLDKSLDATYRAETRFTRIVGVFAWLAIFVACLGLFGLATFLAGRRTKEIGIRKALGASAASIVGLLSKDFARLVAVGFLLAAPLAYAAMRSWLSHFAYRTEIDPWIFIGAGAITLSVAIVSVSWQAIHAARIDPVRALRAE